MTDLHDQIRDWWDEDAGTYDASPSHAMADPLEAACWRAALLRYLPPPPARVLDAGAGTGAISLLAAELGYEVTALDLSAAMLARAREKAEARGIVLKTIEDRAESPPPGPFDAVVERHLLWTMPDPAGALSAWRAVAPNGRLVLFEGVFGRTRPVDRVRDRAIGAVRRLQGTGHDHHAEYPPEVLAALPLINATSPGPLLEAVEAAGWRHPRIERMRDVEWARRQAAGTVLGPLEHVDRFALVADA